ncbi:MAG: methyltransferase domain-containing protein [Akkermansiaceae bacterium]
MPSLWTPSTIGNQSYFLMNLDHSQVEKEVIAEMEGGVDVYYDRRWEITTVLTDWLAKHPEVMDGKRVLILGAGVGAETLILARHGSHIWINDLSATALKLCAEQLEKNGLQNFTPILGLYQERALPEVDLVVASFLIYNDETFQAMRSFVTSHRGEIILVNERLAPFPKFLELEKHEIIFEQDGAVGVLLEGAT